MSLSTQLQNLAVRTGTEFKSIRAVIGTLVSLTTAEKGSLVGAINEINAKVGAGGNITVDAITDAGAIGKSVLRTTTQSAARSAIGAGTSDLVIGTTGTTAKAGNYVPTWGEVSGKPVVIASGADAAGARSSISVSSTSEMNAAITTAINNIVNGAPVAFDTLKEIADYINSNETAIGTITTALANRLRVDASQSLTEPQKVQGRANLDVYSKTEIGNNEIDLVAVFEAALV